MSGEFDLLGMTSPEEAIRRVMRQIQDNPEAAWQFTDEVIDDAARANTDPEAVGRLRAELDAKHGAADVFDTGQLRKTFEIAGFCMPYFVVRRKADRQLGTLIYTKEPQPRFYYRFVPYAD
jgi:hypothetical protein